MSCREHGYLFKTVVMEAMADSQAYITYILKWEPKKYFHFLLLMLSKHVIGNLKGRLPIWWRMSRFWLKIEDIRVRVSRLQSVWTTGFTPSEGMMESQPKTVWKAYFSFVVYLVFRYVKGSSLFSCNGWFDAYFVANTADTNQLFKANYLQTLCCLRSRGSAILFLVCWVSSANNIVAF